MAREQAGSVWGTDVVVDEVLGHPCRVFTPRPVHLRQLIEDSIRHGSRDHLVQGNHRLTFEELGPAVDRLGAHLQRLGLEPGDRVLLFGANSISWVVAFWTCVCNHWVVVPGNAWWSAEEAAFAAGHVGARLALADERRRPRLPAGIPTVDLASVASLGHGERAPVGSAPIVATAEDDPAMILFTSGTTTFPKGATLTHRSLLANLHNLLSVGRRLPSSTVEPKAASVTLMTLPLFHIGGIQQLLTAIVDGATLVFLDGRFQPETVLARIAANGVTAWSAVPTMVVRVLDLVEADGAAFDVSTVRSLIMGGAPVPEALRARAAAAFPNASRGLGISYGLTEASGVLAAGRALAGRPGAVGRLLPTVEAKIDDPDGEGVGELLVRSPGVMRGYWGVVNDSVLTPDRWLRTGDLGRLDEDGFLLIVGRGKDVVIRGGENIASVRVEERLAEHPSVAEAAVVGLPHPDLGEELGAAVVLHPGREVAEGELASFAAETLAYFEVPTAWWFREQLPKNAMGKVVKRLVADEWKTTRTSRPEV